jgi:hypothetical protein
MFRGSGGLFRRVTTWFLGPELERYIFIDVQEARSLPAGDPNGWSDPYTIIQLTPDIEIGRTRVITRTLNPRWIQRFSYSGSIDLVDHPALRFTVADRDQFSRDDILGVLELPLSLFEDHQWETKWYRLKDPTTGKPVRGWIHLRIHWVEQPSDAFRPQTERTTSTRRMSGNRWARRRRREHMTEPAAEEDEKQAAEDDEKPAAKEDEKPAESAG